MSDRANAYINKWRVNRSDASPPFLSTERAFEISKDSNGDFFLHFEHGGDKHRVSLHFNDVDLFMKAPAFSLRKIDPSLEYIINFKLATQFSIGRSGPTLYCTTQIQTLSQTGDIQDSEQGVFGAEEDGGSTLDDPKPLRS